MTAQQISRAHGKSAGALAALSTAAEAEFEGDYETTLRLLHEAQVLGQGNASVHAHVHWTTAKFFARHDRWFTAIKHALLVVVVSVF